MHFQKVINGPLERARKDLSNGAKSSGNGFHGQNRGLKLWKQSACHTPGAARSTPLATRLTSEREAAQSCSSEHDAAMLGGSRPQSVGL